MRLFYSLATIVLLIISCSTTELTSSWREPGYRGQVEKVLIIGVAHKPSVRKLFEDEFTKQLKSRGVDAVPSHQIISAENMLKKEKIVEKIKDLEIDAVLITRLVEEKKENRYRTQYVPVAKGWHGSYVGGQGYVYATGEKVENIILVLETTLYDTETDKAIWSALSESFLMEYADSQKEVKSFIEVMMKNLSDQKLIK